MLDLRHVSKTFNAGTINERAALTDVDLHLDEGEFVTVIGGNGAGKSTMLNAIAGVWPVDAGSVTIGGVDVTGVPDFKRAGLIGRVFQDPMMGTAGAMQIEENLALAYRRGEKRDWHWFISKEERENYKKELGILGLGLEDRLTTRVDLLSGGQRQALTLLMATLRRPKLLLLDEHTAALDPKTAQTVLETTGKLVTAYGLTTLMVTHNMKDAISYGDRLIMMNEGRIVLDIRGDAKRALTVEKVLRAFEEVSGEEFASDKALLG